MTNFGFLSHIINNLNRPNILLKVKTKKILGKKHKVLGEVTEDIVTWMDSTLLSN
jgi:hypothetical protein